MFFDSLRFIIIYFGKENWRKFDEEGNLKKEIIDTSRLSFPKLLLDLKILKIFERRIERKGGGKRRRKKKLEKIFTFAETIRVSIVETELNIYAHLRIYGRNAFSKLLFPIYTVIQIRRMLYIYINKEKKFFFSFFRIETDPIHTRLNYMRRLPIVRPRFFVFLL